MSSEPHARKDEVGPSFAAPPSRNDEAQKLCRAFRDEGYKLDDVANAVCDGGLTAGYAAFLQKFKDYPLQVVPRTWKDAPESQEYQERQGCFEKHYLEHLRRVRDSPFKHSYTNAFLDLKKNEHLPRGGLKSKECLAQPVANVSGSPSE